MHYRKRRQSGFTPTSLKLHRVKLALPAFTIVELLVVIVVIGILAAITVVSYTGVTQRATIAGVQSDLSNASKKLKVYQLENETYPIDKVAAVTAKLMPDSNNYYYYVDNTTNPKSFCISYINQDNNIAYSINQDGLPIPAPYCPVLYLDASSPNSYPGSGTTWYDLSGLSNNATLTNGPTFTPDNGGVFSFDGVDDYASLPSMLQSLNLNALTVSVWIKVENGVSQYADWGSYIVHNGSDFSVGSSVYTLAMNTSGTVVFCWSGNYTVMTTATTYNDGSWHHLVGTWDGAQSKLYVDGSLQKTANISVNRSGVLGALNIGGRPGGMARFFNGEISEARMLINRAMSLDEILIEFNIAKGRYGL